jgi:hypothetical protein
VRPSYRSLTAAVPACKLLQVSGDTKAIPRCDCGAYAVGQCRLCDVPICGACGRRYENTFLCSLHARDAEAVANQAKARGVQELLDRDAAEQKGVKQAFISAVRTAEDPGLLLPVVANSYSTPDRYVRVWPLLFSWTDMETAPWYLGEDEMLYRRGSVLKRKRWGSEKWCLALEEDCYSRERYTRAYLKDLRQFDLIELIENTAALRGVSLSGR